MSNKCLSKCGVSAKGFWHKVVGIFRGQCSTRFKDSPIHLPFGLDSSIYSASLHAAETNLENKKYVAVTNVIMWTPISTKLFQKSQCSLNTSLKALSHRDAKIWNRAQTHLDSDFRKFFVFLMIIRCVSVVWSCFFYEYKPPILGIISNTQNLVMACIENF